MILESVLLRSLLATTRLRTNWKFAKLLCIIAIYLVLVILVSWNFDVTTQHEFLLTFETFCMLAFATNF